MGPRLLIVFMTGVAALLAAAPPGRACAQARGTVHVRTTSSPPGVWLHERGAPEDAWTDLCAAPCETESSRGAQLGLSLDGLAPQRVPAPTLVDGAVLRLRYDDQHLTRTYGLIVAVIGVLGAATLGIGGTVAWVAAGGLGDMTGPVTSMVGGGTLLALGLSVGLALMDEGDRLEISLGP